MPPPRRQSSAPKGESKTGLVVALIFFILMTIVLGVVAYMGFDGQKELEGKAETAAADAKKATAAEQDARARHLAYQIMTGTAAAPTGEALGALNSNAAFRAELAAINQNFSTLAAPWDPKTDQLPESLLVLVKKLREERDTSLNNMKTALATSDRTKVDYEQKEQTAEAGKKQAETEQEKFSKTASDAQKKEQEAKNFAQNEIKSLSTKLKDLMAAKENVEQELRLQIKRLEEDKLNSGLVIDKFKSSQDVERVRIFLTDKVHGVVRKVDSTNQLAYIDLGSADFVRPGMTFSILLKFDNSATGVDTALQKKATLEVTHVLGEKQSQARIRYAEGVSSIANPVEVGDKLYKPGWKPGTPVRWALAGHFDLNGLGRDETLALKNRLAKNGIVVDAYLDLNTLKIVGELNHGIDYLVVGNRPTGETARVVGEERKKAIEDAINDMVAQAQKMNIHVVQHRVFLPISGIDLPSRQAFPYFPGGAAPDAPKPEDKPKEEKPKEEKKDEKPKEDK